MQLRLFVGDRYAQILQAHQSLAQVMGGKPSPRGGSEGFSAADIPKTKDEAIAAFNRIFQ